MAEVDFMMLVSEGRMSPRAECPPGHSALGHTVPPDIVPWCAMSPRLHYAHVTTVTVALTYETLAYSRLLLGG